MALPEAAGTVHKEGKLLQYKSEGLLQRRTKRYFSGNAHSRNKLKSLLYKSDLSLSTPQILLGTLVKTFVLAAVLTIVVRMGPYKSLFVSLMTSTLVLLGIVLHRANQYEQSFSDNFPLALDIIVRGLKAGFTLEKTFITVAEEIEKPVGNEFLSITEQINFGVPYEEALKNVGHKIDHPDFDFFVVALVIQRRTGGPLSELIEKITFVLRKREELRLKIKAVSAEARATGMIVGSLPFIAALAMMYLKPGYIQDFASDEVGRKLLFAVFAMIGGMAVIVRQLTKFKL